jgi:hypothetical protein
MLALHGFQFLDILGGRVFYRILDVIASHLARHEPRSLMDSAGGTEFSNFGGLQPSR